MSYSLVNKVLPVLILLTGCASVVSNSTLEESTDANGNFTLYVSNQSFVLDRVDIHVEIDGRLVVNRNFRVDTQHTFVPFKILLERGVHHIHIWSTKGGAELSTDFQLEEEDTAVITYWYKPGVSEKSFHFETMKGPFYIV